MQFPLLILFVFSFIQGCAQAPLEARIPERLGATQPLITSKTSDDRHGYVRSSRYTLISTAPKPEQLDLLLQIIDIQIPPSTSPSVRDALKHMLLRSGYRLCEATPSLRVLYSRPLPAAHHALGPMPLKTALQVIAGPAWQLQADSLSRTVCFEQHAEAQP